MEDYLKNVKNRSVVRMLNVVKHLHNVCNAWPTADEIRGYYVAKFGLTALMSELFAEMKDKFLQYDKNKRYELTQAGENFLAESGVKEEVLLEKGDC